MFRAVRATEHPLAGLDTVPDDACAAMVADRSKRLNGTFEGIEGMFLAERLYDEGLVVIVPQVSHWGMMLTSRCMWL
jgi:hypothetical protein